MKTVEEQRLYWAWAAMRQRCENPRNRAYKNYGARGIRVCNEWQDFSAFLRDMGLPKCGMTLERINNNGNYSKENCVWADRYRQSQNRRFARVVEVGGVEACIKEHWRRLSPEGVSYRRVMKRIDDLGWSYFEALTTPTRRAAK